MRRKNRKNFEKHVDNRMNNLHKKDFDIGERRVTKNEVELSKEIIEERNTIDVPHKKEIDVDKIRAQKNEVELSKEIIEEEKTSDVPYRKEFDIDKIRTRKGEVEISNEIADERKIIDVPHVSLLSWIGGTVLLFWVMGLIFSIGGLMIHWLLLIAAIIFIVNIISIKSRRET